MVLFSFLIANTLHEFGHAYAADRLGDPTPRSQERISLNPLDHLDLIGTIVIVVSAFTGGLFGWGKPVQVNANNFKNPRRDHILVTFAGPLANLVLACISAFLVRTNAFHQSPGSAIGDLLVVSTELNVVLFLFNLIPVPPLDGSQILANALPANQAMAYVRFMTQFGLLFLVLAMFLGWPLIAAPFYSIVTTLLG